MPKITPSPAKDSRALNPAQDFERAGSLGEQNTLADLRKICAELGLLAKIYPSPRVPKPKSNGKFEIDILLLSKALLVIIEVKHWSGLISQTSRGFHQSKTHESKTHPDPLAQNVLKREALEHWLLQQGMTVPPHRLISLLVLSHPNCQVAAELSSRNDIVKLIDLKAQLTQLLAQGSRSLWERFIKDPWSFHQLKRCLDRLPSWDRIQLTDGHVYQGDFTKIQLKTDTGKILQRQDMQAAHILAPTPEDSRRKLPLRLVLEDWRGRRRIYNLDRDSYILMHMPGRERPETIAIERIIACRMGRRDSAD